jgi:tRNA A-37 threonylcarbamoyl transferase component Bud32
MKDILVQCCKFVTSYGHPKSILTSLTNVFAIKQQYEHLYSSLTDVSRDLELLIIIDIADNQASQAAEESDTNEMFNQFAEQLEYQNKTSSQILAYCQEITYRVNTSLPAHADGSNTGMQALVLQKVVDVNNQILNRHSLSVLKINSDLLEWNKSSSKLIGQGSFADVYECKYENKQVALKYVRLFNSIPSEQLNSILNEAKLLSVVKHRNIISFEGCDLQQGLFIIELAQASLFQVLYRRNDPQVSSIGIELSLLNKIQWCSDIASGLRHLHFHKILHRDLKPANVLMCLHNGKFIAKISDFGVSVSINSTILSSLASDSVNVSGTSVYMAPELLSFDGIAPTLYESDIYSFGILMNESK